VVTALLLRQIGAAFTPDLPVLDDERYGHSGILVLVTMKVKAILTLPVLLNIAK